jgi:guanylate kinase
MTKGHLFVMSAASGAGKTTLKDLVLPEFPQLRYSISCTTRKPRTGEVNGVHYYFKTPEEFKAMIAAGQLAEWNEVHGNFYGTPRKFIEDTLAQGNSMFFDLDVFGKVNFDKIYSDAIGILVLPPSLEVLERRLRDRGTDSDEVIRLRLENSRKEMEFAQSQGKYEHTIVNDDLAQAAELLRDIFRRHF